MKKIVNWIPAFTLLAALAFSSCTVKDDTGSNNGSSRFQVFLTDNPANFTKVNVHIRAVMVNLTDNATDGWITLPTNGGIYDLLNYQNGKDTLLAQGTIPAETVKQIRLVLGTDNTVDIADLTYPLTIPPDATAGLKIGLNKEIRMPVESVTIDFDAAASVHDEGNGFYTLRPVLSIRTK